MKSLLIEKIKIGNIDSDAIILHDLSNKKSEYIFTDEPNYENWVNDKATEFSKNGYFIFNDTEIILW